jgi:O-antigen ligase
VSRPQAHPRATGTADVTARAAVEAARRLETARRRRLADDWPHTSRPLPWALAGFMAMVWLAPFDSVSLPIPIPLDAKLDRPFLVLLGALWLLSLTGRASISRLRMSSVHWALFLLLLVALLSLVLNAETIVRLNELDLALRKLALLFSYALLFVIVASTVKPTEVRNLIVFMVGLAALTSVGTLVEYRMGYNAFFTWTGQFLPLNLPPELGAVDSIGRKSIVGPTIHPLAVAMMMSLALPFALMGIVSSKERRDKILYGLAAGLMVAAALATQRKTSIVAPIFGVAVLFAYRPRAALRLIPVGILLLVLIQVAAPGAMGGVTTQLMPQNLFGVLSTKDRQSDYGAIKPDVIKHPVLGRGYESYDQKKYRILDNQYLTLVIGTGVLGVLAYLGVFAAVLLLAHRLARAGDPELAPFAIAASASIASLIVGSALLDTLALAQLPYLICFIAGLVVVASQGSTAAASATARRAVRMALAEASARRPRLTPEEAR